jgi:hypothetical protein
MHQKGKGFYSGELCVENSVSCTCFTSAVRRLSYIITIFALGGTK